MKIIGISLLFLLLLLHSGCTRQPIPVEDTPTPLPSALRPPSVTPMSPSTATRTSRPTVTSSSTPLPSGTPAPARSPLRDWPLQLGSYWVYSATVYYGSQPDQIIYGTFVVTDTVVQAERRAELFIAEVERVTERIQGDIDIEDYLGRQRPGSSWYIVRETQVYQQYREPLNLDDLATTSELPYVFPLTNRSYWAENSLNREADYYDTWTDGPHLLETEAGSFTACYQVVSMYLSGGTVEWVCPGIGVVEALWDHHGSIFGYHEALLAYHLAEPP